MTSLSNFDLPSIPATFKGGMLSGTTTNLSGTGVIIGPDGYYVPTNEYEDGRRVFAYDCDMPNKPEES